MTRDTLPRDQRVRRTAWLLGALAVSMFGFGFALVPLYSVLCEATGIQSVSLRNPVQAERPPRAQPDDGRELLVKFDLVVQPDLPWDFSSEVARIVVRPGQSYAVTFYAKNRSNERVTGQAIPNITPWQATPYFHKVECFCFNRQILAAGEAVEMPLRFIVSPDLPRSINSLTLSYSFMKAQNTDAPLKVAGLNSALLPIIGY